MEKFTLRLSKNACYTGLIVGDEVESGNGQKIIVTNIVRVTLEKDYVMFQGYGMTQKL